MRNLTYILFIFVFSFSFSQNKSADTAQVVVPNRTNSALAKEKPYLILISADGFRYDYAKKYNAENLLNLSKQGVSAKAMLPTFPSITFPNHWSLITGLYPSHHGLVDNFFYDYSRKEFYAMSKKENAEDGSWYGGTPLWSLAEKQGVVSASLHWVGSASEAGGARPTYYYHYHEKFTPEEKISKVINWLKLPEDVRPHFISLYFPEVDAAGHHYGPESEEAKNSVKLVDSAVGNLVKKVNELGLKNVNFIFVSDHGMIKVDKENPLYIPEILLDKERFDIFNSQTLLRVIVKNPNEIETIYHQLKDAKSDDYKVILTKRFPRKLHYGTKDDKYNRIGQILLVPNAPKIFLEKGKSTSVGKHGYNPRKTPEMKAVFYAWGDVFKNNLEINEFSNVNVYPLVAEILGLKITEPIDGKVSVLQKTLK
ncbi:alkaline phosphatase family protein [Cloacibacterium rupense]|uniref:Alkaline phosphatase family protein n=1 Tax=Cloacibacterium rupense TaxID=517423 RepID=A0ABQ2NK90_9FLAO|nr:ectonucleotide pyrophosphatase/phosphodiesterase [Cloacibacterium rupense]GGP04584.1 alkaline phosphatase family protein [Cloacibacterium rupense]